MKPVRSWSIQGILATLCLSLSSSLVVFISLSWIEIKSDTDLAGLSNLDSLQFADDFTVINPLQGLFTVLDFSEVMLFLDQSENFIINSAELEVGLTSASIDPIERVNFYTLQ